MIPDERKALELHRKYGSSERTVEHCKAVAGVSMLLAEGIAKNGVTVDSGVVYAGAMLHDIGRSRVQTVRHGLEGAEILRSEGVDERVVETVRRHVGAGISPEEAKELGLPAQDYVPRTVEERIVCFADKMVDSATVRPFQGEVERFRRKGHDVDRLLSLKRSVDDDLGGDSEALALGKTKERDEGAAP